MEEHLHPPIGRLTNNTTLGSSQCSWEENESSALISGITSPPHAQAVHDSTNFCKQGAPARGVPPTMKLCESAAVPIAKHGLQHGCNDEREMGPKTPTDQDPRIYQESSSVEHLPCTD
ncbi:hypothetical protein JHW43_006397 [Diplocarpon mali]|nr:hypothetical protein JHW43_006397 [Diplocarpon mali]